MEAGSAEGARECLGRHFRSRSGEILADWLAAVAAAPSSSTGRSLPRSQLEDHLPLWLDAFAGVLEAPPGRELDEAESEELRDAMSHGLQRWQQGYDLREVTLEWGLLHRQLVLELERFAGQHPEIDVASFSEARLKLAEQISEATSSSASQYFELEKLEAIGNVKDLEQALTSIKGLELARAELWQQAAHDLRGNLGVVSNVAHGLGFRDLAPERQQKFLGLLTSNVESLRLLLDDVTSLARLQAGQEQRQPHEFDAASMLRRLCDELRNVAEKKGLTLDAEGPDVLSVVGDEVKVRRVAQNLLLNALKYTRNGGVIVSWGEAAGADGGRWSFSVKDTGPGFHAGPGAPMLSALTDATAGGRPGPQPAVATPVPDGRDISQVQGEGIGLAIVKRLCELLDAAVEFESTIGQGSTFRIVLPRSYG